MAATCRFCFEEELDPRDPLLSPCNCTGSMKFIHQGCLRRWRSTTENEQFRVRCVVCAAAYQVQRRHPAELIPNYANYSLFYLLDSRIFMILLAHYLHIMFIAHLVPMPRGFDDVGHAMAFRLHTRLSLFVYYSILTALTTPYFFLYSIFLETVVNAQLYIFYAPIYFAKYLVAAAGCLYLVQYSVFPFGGMYVALLPCIFQAHKETLERINAEGVVL
jgi:hypothetical protein